MLKAFAFSFFVLTASLFTAEKEDFLVCIHGFLGSPWNMSFLKNHLIQDGWDIINWGYPSRDHFIAEHGEHLVQDLRYLAKMRPGRPMHFVTHSMGGLILLSALNHPSCPKEAQIGKVVLITPPLNGSSWARWLGQFSLARWLTKDFSGRELMTETNFDHLGDFPDSLDGILVIAGSFGFNPLLKGKNDGTITLNETFLSSPHEQAELNHDHKTILFSKETYSLIKEFICK